MFYNFYAKGAHASTHFHLPCTRVREFCRRFNHSGHLKATTTNLKIRESIWQTPGGIFLLDWRANPEINNDYSDDKYKPRKEDGNWEYEDKKKRAFQLPLFFILSRSLTYLWTFRLRILILIPSSQYLLRH